MNAPNVSLKGLDLRAEIDRLRKEREAVVLAHYYQTPEIQDLADFVGDSLDLSRKAQATDAEGDRLLRRPLHGRDGEDPLARQDRRAARHERRLQPGGQLPARAVQGVPRGPSGPYRAHLHQQLGRGERRSATSSSPRSSAETILAQIPKEQKIIFGPDKHLGGYLARQDRARHAALAGRLHRPRGLLGDRAAEAEGAASRRAGARPSRMPAAHPRPCRLCRRDLGHPPPCAGEREGQVHHRHRAAHHPPDGESGAGQDLHRRAGRGRELQLQHVPVHGAEHAGEALRRAARSSAADRDRGGPAPRREGSRSTGCWRWPATRSARAMSAGRRSAATDRRRSASDSASRPD